MEVMLMSGGFRGLGALATEDQLALLGWLERGTRNLEPLIGRVRTAATARQIPVEVAQTFDRLFESLRARIVTLTDRLGGPEFESGVVPDVNRAIARWRSDAAALITDVRLFERDARTALGEVQITGAKVAVIATGTALLLGGAIYALYRYSRRRRR